MSSYRANLKNINKAIADTAHEIGLEVYGAHRMEAGDFFFPFALESHNYGDLDEYARFSCKTRLWRETKVLSYAYPEVRKIMAEIAARQADDLDGISLILHRGMHVMFEDPVIDAVREKYGIDARKLPFADERLHGVMCGFMTEFMRELKRIIGKDKKINVIVFYDPTSCKQFALDIETWAKENLIDSVSQGIMRHFEDIDDCIGDDGLIDLEKFEKVNGERQTIKRDYYDGNFDFISKGSTEFLKILKKYGKQYFGSLGWESMSPQDAFKLAMAQKNAGVEQFISWDGNHKAKRLPILNAEKYISKNFDSLNGDSEMPSFVKYTRVLSVFGTDISSFNPNWKG